MTRIVLDINGIDGDVTIGTAFTDVVPALGVQDVVLATGGDSETQLSEVCVFRTRDRATPKLMSYAAGSIAIADLTIHILDSANVTAFKWSLESVGCNSDIDTSRGPVARKRHHVVRGRDDLTIGIGEQRPRLVEA